MDKLTGILKALSDETRLRILNLLFERDCCVCEIMQILAISQSRVSHHVSVMCNAGLMKQRQQGRFSVYAIDWERFDSCGADMLKAIRRGLEGNKLAKEDLRKLAQAGCVLPNEYNKHKSNFMER